MRTRESPEESIPTERAPVWEWPYSARKECERLGVSRTRRIADIEKKRRQASNTSSGIARKC